MINEPNICAEAISLAAPQPPRAVSDFNLYTSSKAEWDVATAPDELARLEREIAETQSRERIISYSSNRYAESQIWWNITIPNGYTHKAIRYLDLRGLLERHPTNSNLMRLKG